jgi:hypothetical protein
VSEPDRERLYVARAKDSIRAVLDEQLAVVSAELEARISERSFIGERDNIDPHHVTTALRELTRAGVVTSEKVATKGGHDIETIQPADQQRRATKISHAAARKRLLAARYTGWSQGTKRHPQGLVGPAGEQAARTAVLDTQTFLPAAQGAGEVTELLGVRLPGPPDIAGYMVPFINGMPGVTVTLLLEVKNIRGWVYPQSLELYQVLHKACVLQQARPDQPIVPMLICRRAHITTFWMAKQLGFVVIDMRRQFTGEVDEHDVAEVRNELHFHDLVRGSDRSIRVYDRIRNTMPGICSDVAAVWKQTCMAAGYAPLFEQLRAKTRLLARRELMTELRAVAIRHGLRGGW